MIFELNSFKIFGNVRYCLQVPSPPIIFKPKIKLIIFLIRRGVKHAEYMQIVLRVIQNLNGQTKNSANQEAVIDDLRTGLSDNVAGSTFFFTSGTGIVLFC